MISFTQWNLKKILYFFGKCKEKVIIDLFWIEELNLTSAIYHLKN